MYDRLKRAALLVALAVCAAACGQKAAPAVPLDSPAVQAESGRPPVEPADAADSAASPAEEPAGTPSPGASVAAPAQNAEPQPSGAPSPSSASPAPAAPSSSAAASDEAPQNVTISVTGNAEWGVIVAPETVEWKEGETVAELLIRTLKAHKLAYDARGAGALFYVEGIDGLFEFDDGPTSGWEYRVNGKTLGVGAGATELQPGDRVEWIYVSEDSAQEAGGTDS